MPRPILTTPPFARAWWGLRHRPGLLITSAVVGLIVGLVAAAPVLFVSSVGAGAVQVQWSDACPASVSPTLNAPPSIYTLPQLPSNPPGVPDLNPIDVLSGAVGSDPAFLPPERIVANYSANPVSAGGQEANIGFLVRRDALEHVVLLGEQVQGEVWVPDTLRDRLAIEPGDTISVSFRDGRVEPLVVAGVFRDLAAAPLDQYWCAATDAIVPKNMYGEIFPPPMAIVSADTFVEHDLGASSLRFSRYVAEFASPPATLAAADRLAAATARVAGEVEAVDASFSTTSGIERLASRASLVRSAVRDTTLPVAALAAVCALALAGVLGVLWLRTRRNTCTALLTIGISPAMVGVKAAVETALAVLAGTAGGALACRASMGVWAPSTELEPGAMSNAFVVALVAGVAAVALVGVAAGWSARTLLRVAAPAKRGWVRFVPFELGLAALAWWAANDVQPGGVVPLEGRRVVDTSASALILPLSVLALGAALVARLWWWLTGRRRSASLPTQLPRRLAVRRLQYGSKAGSALLGAGTLALGVSVFGLAMNSSLERTGVAKSAVFVGSDASLLIAGSLPAGTPGATEVWTRQEMDLDGTPVDVIAIDPASFAAVAFWDDAFADESLATLVARIDESAPGEGTPGSPAADARGVAGTAPSAVSSPAPSSVSAPAPVPVLAVGEIPTSGGLSNPGTGGEPVAVEVVGTVRSFPGAGSKRPTVVTTIAAMQDGPIKFRHYVWVRGSFEDWRVRLQELGAQPMLGISRQDAIDSSVLQFAQWSFDFVRALGVFVGLLAVAALLLHLAARQRQQALGFAFLRRMGLAARRHWWALVLEVGGLMAIVVSLGISLALVCVRLVTPNVDPLPLLPPDPLMVVPWVALVGVAMLGGAVTLVGSAAAQSLGARVDVAEVLRDGT